MKRKLVTWWLVGLLTFGSLAACSNPSSGSSPGSSPSGSPSGSPSPSGS